MRISSEKDLQILIIVQNDKKTTVTEKNETAPMWKRKRILQKKQLFWEGFHGIMGI